MSLEHLRRCDRYFDEFLEDIGYDRFMRIGFRIAVTWVAFEVLLIALLLMALAVKAVVL